MGHEPARGVKPAGSIWIRAAVFTLLVPGTVAVLVPYLLSLYFDTAIELGNLTVVGIPFLLAGLLLYGTSVKSFVMTGQGTPAIWFTAPMKAVIGSEPAKLVVSGLYRWTRNPMYLGVVLIVFGEGLLLDDLTYHFYACFLWVVFHGVVRSVEEPHLKTKFGDAYIEYCKTTPRWVGFGGADADPDEAEPAA